MSETMVERVARAICRAAHPDMPWDRVIEFYPQARAAIAAMREPTQDMEFDGAHVLPDYDPGCEDAKACWQAMIDAALKE
ncbi:MAG: hypothetical protein KGS44_13145 [Alphaproteobacteria bacterium]|nr:hypothetical protein [Alphaproteobacteria bacterium]